MAHHNSTPASVLNAPKLRPQFEPSPANMLDVGGGKAVFGRAAIRAEKRRRRLARPVRIAEPRIRPERATTPEAQQAREDRRREAAIERLALWGRRGPHRRAVKASKRYAAGVARQRRLERSGRPS